MQPILGEALLLIVTGLITYAFTRLKAQQEARQAQQERDDKIAAMEAETTARVAAMEAETAAKVRQMDALIARQKLQNEEENEKLLRDMMDQFQKTIKNQNERVLAADNAASLALEQKAETEGRLSEATQFNTNLLDQNKLILEQNAAVLKLDLQLQGDLRKAQADLVAAVEKIEPLQKQIDEFKATVKRLTEAITAKDNRIKTLTKERDEARIDAIKFRELQEQVEELRQQIADQQTTIDTYSARIDELEREKREAEERHLRELEAARQPPTEPIGVPG